MGVRRLFVDDTFFQTIDTESKAYWLGFFFADGCIATHNTIHIHLGHKDLPHLKTFKQAIKSQHTITPRANSYQLCVVSEQIVTDLLAHGMRTRKNRTSSIPTVPSNLQRHFWRGVVDGDGTIAQIGKQAVLAVAGWEATCSAFQLWLASYGIKCGVRRMGRIWQAYISSSQYVKAACQLLYGEATIALSRKQERADYYRQLQFKESDEKTLQRNARRRARRIERNPAIKSRGPKVAIV